MNYKKDFPIFNNNKNLVYLDSASTSLTPKLVIDEMTKYYTHYGSNIGESESKITINTTKKFNENREALANFINANNNEIVFTYNSTAAANFIVYGLKNTFNKGDEIILTHLEHSSNLLPWIRMIELKGIKIIYAPLKDGIIDISKLENIISHKTKVMSFNHISNSVGGLNDAKNISSILKKHNIISILDASQSAGHILIDVKKLDIDFMFFAPHKMFASTGIGILYGKRKMLDKLNPIIIGGGSASEIDIDDNSFSYNQVPYKLEAGTPNISGVFSLKPAIDYVNSIGIKNMWKHIIDLKKYAIKKLSTIEGITIYNKNFESAIIGFNIKGVSPQDLDQHLGINNVVVRTGKTCVLHISEVIEEFSYVRISLSIYNDESDIDTIVELIKNRGDLLDAFFN